VNDASIGEHVRHALDHYSCLFNGLAQNLIEYDNRERRAEVEESRSIAKSRLRDTIEQLRALLDSTDHARTLQVKLLTGDGKTVQQSQATPGYGSSLARELAFLHSHTVHHNASVAVLLRLYGVGDLVPRSLGIAPATTQYQEQKKCAR